MVVIMMMVVMMTIDNYSDGDVGSNGGTRCRQGFRWYCLYDLKTKWLLYPT